MSRLTFDISAKVAHVGVPSTYQNIVFSETTRPIELKLVRALRGYFGPPMRPKNENCFSLVSSYYFVRTLAQVLKSGIDSIFTIAKVTKMCAKIG